MECVTIRHFYPRKAQLFDRGLILPVGTKSILINQAKSNYPIHTNGEEAIWHRTGVGLLFCTL